MPNAFSYLVEHLMTFTFPMVLGIIILLLTLRRWLTKHEK